MVRAGALASLWWERSLRDPCRWELPRAYHQRPTRQPFERKLP